MIPLDFNFCRGGEIAIIDMRTHVLLLDYSNNTFRKFYRATESVCRSYSRNDRTHGAMNNLSKAHICYTCHVVRCCKGCCKACKTKCSCPHMCSRDMMTVNEGWNWFHYVRQVIDCDAPLVRRNIPEHLRERVERMAKEPIQLQLEFT